MGLWKQMVGKGGAINLRILPPLEEVLRKVLED